MSSTAPAPGILDGMPYALKDMFVSSTRRPHGGLAQPLPMPSSRQAEVLTLLDHAGARRIGTTAMTELAFEPSGLQRRARRAEKSLEFRLRYRRLVIGFRGRRRQRLRRLRARIRHRRLAAHSGALLRRHLMETDLRRRAGCRRDAPLPEPGHDRHPRPQRVGSAGTRAHAVSGTRGRTHPQGRRQSKTFSILPKRRLRKHAATLSTPLPDAASSSTALKASQPSRLSICTSSRSCRRKQRARIAR